MKKGVATIVFLLALAGLYSCRMGREEASRIMVIESVDPLEKIFRETSIFKAGEAFAEVARNEHATLQFVLRCTESLEDLSVKIRKIESETGALEKWDIGYVGYVEVGRNTPQPSRDKLYSLSGFYPDPILREAPENLPAGLTQPVWITVPIPPETNPGIYEGELVFTGKTAHKRFKTTKNFSIKVYEARIPGSSLWVTNWFTVNPVQLARMNNGIVPEQFSDEYWSLVRLLAANMAEYRQNVALISPLHLAGYTLQDSIRRIDFSNFDRMVEIFIEEGVVGRIEGGHIAGRESSWTTPFVVYVPVMMEDSTVFEPYPITNDTARAFYNQFIPEFDVHLRQKGWSGIYLQHIADEPIPENIASYVEISRFIKELAPGFRIVEACHTRDLEDMVDVWVPQMDFLHADIDFYKEKQEEGDEVWYYTCLAPQGNYANRFIELPLVETRILHWINFRYGIDGYLHWGLNHWRGDPFRETTGIITESGNVLPGGDAWIVYPGYRKVLPSIRLEAMRDGIADYELLRMLEEQYPEEAAEIARQVVYQFDRYDTNIDAFRQKRRQILELLSNVAPAKQ